MGRYFGVAALLLWLVCIFLSLASVRSAVVTAVVENGTAADAVKKALDSSQGSILLLKNETSNGSIIIPLERATHADEKKDSLAIFFILLIIVLAILLVHALIISEFHYMPESLAIVLLGALIGFILSYSRWDWREVERLNPNIFLLVLLPPIIFESGYNLHKGNFFANIVPILMFSVLGTAISAFVMGFVLYVLGWIGLIYRLTAVESFAFGSLISAVDPVITLAIFQAIKVDVQLYMLAFGESMLNDAVSIVLASTAMEMTMPALADLTTIETFHYATLRFLSMFFVSAAVGSAVGFISALLFKHVDLRRTPSLELALLLVFSYLPYGLAEAIGLSGIMAILFCAITMSQYTHFNVSPVTQITMQQTFRTLSFVAETCTFAYLGLALFTIKLVFYPGFLIWSIILLFASRAANIFPLSYLINKCTKAKISMKNQIIMWFSGMRGAVAFALALYMEVKEDETKRVLLTSTLVIVLFTIIFLGGSAMPMIKVLSRTFPDDKAPLIVADGGSVVASASKRRRMKKSRRRLGRMNSPVILSKTQEMVIFDNSEHFTKCEDVVEGKRSGSLMPDRKNILTVINENIVRPLFVRKFTAQEQLENRQKLRHIASEAMKNNRNETDVNNSDSSSGDESFFHQPAVALAPMCGGGAQLLLPL